MKNFHRDHPQLSLCGLNCLLCGMHVGGYCPGCGGGEGNQSCAIARCSMEREVQFCFDCGEYPCKRYEGFAEYDSFLPCSRRQRDFERVQEIGLSAYLAELTEKRGILDGLLAHCNDGRHKTFFLTAVYLLEPADVRDTWVQLKALPQDMPVKQKAALAGDLFQKQADARGISLKLRKKPGKL